MADTPNNATGGSASDEQLAQQYQPGSDLGDSLRQDNTYLNAQNRPNTPAPRPQEDAQAPDMGGSSSDAPAAVGSPARPAGPSFAQRMAHAAMDVFGMSRSATQYVPDGKGGVVAVPGAPQKPGDWARGLLAGALRGLGAASTAKSKGLGGLGTGATAQLDYQDEQDQKNYTRSVQNNNEQRQQAASDLAQKREERETTGADRDYKLRLAEDARQQATSIQQAAGFEKRSVMLDQEIAKGNFDAVKQQADYLQAQGDQWNDAHAHGAKPLEVNGAASPEFDHLGDAEKFAMENPDATMHDGYKTRLMRNPDSGKWTIMEMPADAPKWHDITDAAGKPQRIFGDTMAALAAQEQVAKTKHYLNVAAKSSMELKKDLEAYKEEGSVKGARKELDKLGADENGLPQYGKLSPGSKSAMLNDSQLQFTRINAMISKIEAKLPELRTPEENDALTTYGPMRTQYANTIAALTRPSFAPPPGAAKNTAPQFKPQQAPAGAAPPKQGFVYGQGPKGLGWYNPQSIGAPPPAAAQQQQAAPEPSEDDPNPGNLQD
jgi:hypothetical protein